MLDPSLLRRIRNDLPMPITIAAFGRDGPPSKRRDDRLVFCCPHCGEMQVAVNPSNNFAHCFACSKNFRNIDLFLLLGCDFATAIAILEDWLARRQSRLSKPPATPEAK